MTPALAHDRSAVAGDTGAIAYVMTHYPRVALTFIAGEIDAVERRGMRIQPFAMNLPSGEDLGSDELMARRDRTTYLKASWPAALGALAGHMLAHPLKTSGLAARALSSAGWDFALMARRLSHLVQASLLAKRCATAGVIHIHAHFGQAPATIAWFGSELMNFGANKRVSWSFTIHGFQDFVDEAVARLDLKANSAAFVVCVSDFTRSQLCRITPPHLWDRFHVVRCGIDLRQFAFRAAKPFPRRPRIVMVGRLSPEKGQLILVQALAELAENGVEAELLLIGDGPLKATINQEIIRFGLRDRVSLAGEIAPAEVNTQLREADIFCLPSFSEGLPVSIMEAMAIGVPVVSTYIGGIPELAIDGKTALTVAAGNVEALAEAINRIIADPALREKIVAAAREEVELRHDRDRNAAPIAILFAASEAKQ